MQHTGLAASYPPGSFGTLATCVERSPAAAAVLLFAAELTVYSLYVGGFVWLQGGGQWLSHLNWYPESVLAAVFAYAGVAPAFTRKGVRADLRSLETALGDAPGAAAEALEPVVSQGGRAVRNAAAGLGLLMGVAITFYPGIWAAGRPPPWSDPELSWGLLRNAALFTLLLRFLALELQVSGALSRLGRESVRVDLLDLEPLTPFTHHGMRSVLRYGVLVAILAWMALGPGKVDWLVASLLGHLGIGLAVLLMPVRGVHRRIRAAKHAELARVRAQLRRSRAELLEGRDTSPRLSELLAWEARVERTAEWPFDAPTALRFLLLLAIPLGSWLGGALVERLLDTLLD
jgi:hypothetical protein